MQHPFLMRQFKWQSDVHVSAEYMVACLKAHAKHQQRTAGWAAGCRALQVCCMATSLVACLYHVNGQHLIPLGAGDGGHIAAFLWV